MMRWSRAHPLIAVGSGLDAGALPSKYPDRAHCAIAHAGAPGRCGLQTLVVALGLRCELSVEEISVPFEFRNGFEHALTDLATRRARSGALRRRGFLRQAD